MKLRELMRTDVAFLKVGDSLDVAAEIMTRRDIRHLPVTDEARAVVGMVSERDVFKAAISSVFEVGQDGQRDWMSKVPVVHVMTRNVVTINPDAKVEEAVDVLLDRKFGCLPVVESGKLIGIVTETDCLRCLREILSAFAVPGARPPNR